MGCLFSKRAASEEDLISQRTRDATSSDAGGAPTPASPAPTRSSVTESAAAPPVSSTPDVLKPMGRGGFADITTGIQEQLGRYA